VSSGVQTAGFGVMISLAFIEASTGGTGRNHAAGVPQSGILHSRPRRGAER
jgi:hypothetical protein